MRQKIWWRAACCGALLLLGLASAAQAGDYDHGTPTTLGDATGLSYGLKDQALNSDRQAVAKARLEQDAVCTTCHDESEPKKILAVYQGPHGNVGDPRTPGCQTCHGPSEKHRTAVGTLTGDRPPPDRIFGTKKTTSALFQPMTPQEQSEVCLSCHKGGLRMRWPGSQHQTNDVACTNCHVNHQPTDPVRVKETQTTVCFTCHKEQRADFSKISHMPIETGKVVCSDCHNPHGAPGPKLLLKNTVNETCFQCHADKRGPFLWEHQPATEDCTNCHTPHGSNITPLLKSRPPFLCDECHGGPHNSVMNAGPSVGGVQSGGVAAGAFPSQMITGRACLNCHVQIHGSNSPAGPFLHR